MDRDKLNIRKVSVAFDGVGTPFDGVKKRLVLLPPYNIDQDIAMALISMRIQAVD